MVRLLGLPMMLGVLVGMSGCGGDKAPTSPALDRFNVQGFPLAVGNKWEYEVSGSSPMSSGPGLERGIGEPAAWKLNAVWEITALDTVLGQPAFRFEITHRWLEGAGQGDVNTGETWFAMQGDTLRSVASRNPEGLDPTSQLHKPVVQSEWDTITLIFPLVAGKSWSFFDLWDDDRKSVIRRGETITVLAGTFDIFLVARTVPELGLRTEQWFSEIGLVKQSYRMELKRRRTGEQGEDLGEFIDLTTSEMKLQSYSLVHDRN